MTVYPEIESWDEFYPSEIFFQAGNDENGADYILKRAPIGAKIYMGTGIDSTTVLKKIGEYKVIDDMPTSFVLVGNIH